MRARVLFLPPLGLMAGFSLSVALSQLTAAPPQLTPVAARISSVGALNPNRAAAPPPTKTESTTSRLLPSGRLVEIIFHRPAPARAPAPGIRPADVDIPLYNEWVRTLSNSPQPRRAQNHLEDLKEIFVGAGIPEALVWLAEAESGFDPRALNANGARGLFQLMPYIAKEQGLRLSPHDERDDPAKNAKAAAAHLRKLYERFDSWPLAIAAYNAGEGCIRRSLKAANATTFGEIADRIPRETRSYVAKVLALLAVRADLDAAELDQLLGH